MAEGGRAPTDRPEFDRPFVDRPVAELDAAIRASRRAADDWGLAPPALLRRGMNALFVSGDVVIRVGMATAHPRLAHELAGVLRDHGVPTVEPLHGLARWVDGLAVSGWRRVVPSDEPIDWVAVGSAVRSVHALPRDALPDGYPTPSPRSFPWWDFEGLLAEVGGAIDAPALAGLRGSIERHATWREEIARGAVVCHGDVHPGNVMPGPDGCPLLLDWDLMCVAAPAWDHAMLTTLAERWGGDPATYREFAAGYGASLADDTLTRSLGELRNVAATLMRVRAGRTDPAAAAEAERRLRYWRGDPAAPAWRPQ